MTPKKFYSEKKTQKQTISISPALKDWIKRYVRKNHNEFPEDERFSSISAFYNFIMEKCLEIFETGKTLDDLGEFADKNIKEFYDDLSFKGTIALHEDWLRSNKYSPMDYKSVPQLLWAIRNMLFENMDLHDPESIKIMFERVENYFKSNKITEDFTIKFLDPEKGEKIHAIIEHKGNYKHLQYENFKFLLLFMGFIGVKITNLLYSERELYFNIEIKSTDLLFEERISRKKRVKLAKNNLDYLINYFNLSQDEDFYTWMKLAEDKNILISFKDKDVLMNWIDNVILDIRKYGEKPNFLLSLLKIFEKIHWIVINSEEKLSFEFNFNDMKCIKQMQIIKDILRKYSQLKEIGNIIYLT